MAKDPKSPKSGKGKFDPDSVEELTDEEMAKVHGGGGVDEVEKSILTSTYTATGGKDKGGGTWSYIIETGSNWIDAHVPKKK